MMILMVTILMMNFTMKRIKKIEDLNPDVFGEDDWSEIDNKELTIEDIKKLKPCFYYGQYQICDWFTISKGHSYCYIKSGLRHADGKTISPFHYDHIEFGSQSLKKCLKHFNKWWYNLNI